MAPSGQRFAQVEAIAHPAHDVYPEDTEVGIERPDEDRSSGVVDVGPERIEEHLWPPMRWWSSATRRGSGWSRCQARDIERYRLTGAQVREACTRPRL